ncbi:MAG: glycosyltransferase family 39 protein [Chloroflexota bacterium]
MSLAPGSYSKNKCIALFSLWALHGMFALWQYGALSPDHDNFLFDASYRQALISGPLFMWVVFNLVLILSLSRNSVWLMRLLDSLRRPDVKDGIFIIAALALLLRLCLGILQGVADRSGDFRFVGYIDKLSPVLDMMGFVFFEMVALITYLAFREGLQNKKLIKTFLAKQFIILALLGLAALYVSLTKMGIVPNYQGDWGRGMPTVALLEWQILLASLFCAGMVFAEVNPNLSKIPRLDLWISLAVWLLTVIIWLGQPIVPNASALEPRAPNFEIYPFSDGQIYDEFAQSALVGSGFGKDSIPSRPLYIVFLAFMHVLAGQDYNAIITIQSILFALFPVLLYLFGREFFGRPVGISIALLAIFRDYTSNLVSPFTGNLSYSKVYLSEIPTAMLLILFLWIGIRWIRSGLPVHLGFLLGGILGVAMLIRAQVAVALPMLFLFALITHRSKFALIIKNGLLTSLMVLLAISPWLWRNWKMTGELVFENPISQMANLALRYSRLNGVYVYNSPLPGESSAEFNQRMTRLANEAMNENPSGVVRAIANSFLNHGVNNILVFPLRITVRDFGELWTPVDPFWEAWEGSPTPSQGAVLAFYVFLFGLGLAAAWQRNGWLGFLPLGVNLLYNLSTSVALISGQRFMLSMDWSIYLYYMIGIFALISIFLFTLERGRAVIVKWYEANGFSFLPQAYRRSALQYVFAGLLFFGIGATLPLSEMVFPQRYPQVRENDILKDPEFSSALEQSSLDSACFQDILDRNQLSTLQGRALYPRFYEAGTGERFTDSAGYKIVDESRLVFQLIGQANQRVVFPTSAPPDFFPNASDATLFVDASENTWFIFVEQGDAQRLYFSEALVLPFCRSSGE